MNTSKSKIPIHEVMFTVCRTNLIFAPSIITVIAIELFRVNNSQKLLQQRSGKNRQSSLDALADYLHPRNASILHLNIYCFRQTISYVILFALHSLFFFT